MLKIEVIIDRDRCKSCELCIHACKRGVLAMDYTALNVKGYSPARVNCPEKCLGCCNCVLMCPDSAISINKIKQA